jgi:hypothetical protein
MKQENVQNQKILEKVHETNQNILEKVRETNQKRVSSLIYSSF